MRVNLDRLARNLVDLGKIGYNEGQGITRIAFTEDYKKGNNFVRQLMEDAELETRQDSVGNLFGRLRGNKSDKTIIIGSHIDTVPNGGMFDGSLGVLAGLECIQTLKENAYTNNYNIEVCVFIGEEGTPMGGTFGSRCLTGKIELNNNHSDALSKMNLTKDDIYNAVRDPKEIQNYLELHIEQGNVLYSKEIPIGIVKGIVGISRYNANVMGKANHAGTTPMNLRDDALVKTSELIIKFNEIVSSIGEPFVGTIGYIDCSPRANNVICGSTSFPIELRDMNKERIKKAIKKFEVENRDMGLTIEEEFSEWEVYLDEEVQSVIQLVCEKLGYEYKYMYSGAGHDANALSQVTPTAMIFVPSKNGISHSPDEWTDWCNIEKGANVLLKTIIKLDKKLIIR